MQDSESWLWKISAKSAAKRVSHRCGSSAASHLLKAWRLARFAGASVNQKWQTQPKIRNGKRGANQKPKMAIYWLQLHFWLEHDALYFQCHVVLQSSLTAFSALDTCRCPYHSNVAITLPTTRINARRILHPCYRICVTVPTLACSDVITLTVRQARCAYAFPSALQPTQTSFLPPT